MRSSTTSRLNFYLAFAALLLSLPSCDSPSGRALEETFEEFYTIEPTANVTIKNADGVVRVYGSDANEMWVQAIKRAYTRQRLKRIAINVSVQPGLVSIETDFPPKPKRSLRDRSGTVEYTIIVPQTASISQLEVANGEVVVEGMYGQTVLARLGNGRMFGHNCFSNAQFTVDRGIATLAYDWWEPGAFTIRADIAHGSALAFLPGNAAFRLAAEAPHGTIASDFPAKGVPDGGIIRKIDIATGSPPNASISLRVEDGNIRVEKAYP